MTLQDQDGALLLWLEHTPSRRILCKPGQVGWGLIFETLGYHTKELSFYSVNCGYPQQRF